MDLATLATRLKELNELAQQANDASDSEELTPASEKTWNRVSAMESKLQTELDFDGSELSVEWSDKHNCFIVF